MSSPEKKYMRLAGIAISLLAVAPVSGCAMDPSQPDDTETATADDTSVDSEAPAEDAPEEIALADDGPLTADDPGTPPEVAEAVVAHVQAYSVTSWFHSNSWNTKNYYTHGRAQACFRTEWITPIAGSATYKLVWREPNKTLQVIDGIESNGSNCTKWHSVPAGSHVYGRVTSHGSGGVTVRGHVWIYTN
jgi:hypothetical protein